MYMDDVFPSAVDQTKGLVDTRLVLHCSYRVRHCVNNDQRFPRIHDIGPRSFIIINSIVCVYLNFSEWKLVWGDGLVMIHLPSICEDLGLITGTGKKKKTETKTNKQKPGNRKKASFKGTHRNVAYRK